MAKEKKNYFGPETDDAIIKFQKSTNSAEREMLCRDFILPAFEKLSSYWYHRLALRKNEESISDGVAYLYEKINMFNPNSEKKTSGFAYFNMVARNYFFQKLRSERKEVLQNQEFVNIWELTSADESLLVDDSLQEGIEKKEFMQLLRDVLPKWRERANKEQERKILDALIVLFENIDNFDIYDSKAVKHHLEEITGMKTKQVSLNLNKIKKKYLKFKVSYQKGDI